MALEDQPATTIGEWTIADLTKFFRDQSTNEPPTEAVTLQVDELVVNTKLTLGDELVHSPFLTYEVGLSGNPAFQNSWVNAGGSRLTARYWKDAMGYVSMAGAIVTGASGSVAFTLPPGFRPKATEEFGTYADTGAATVSVSATGTVTPTYTGIPVWVTLSGIIFRAAT